MKKCPSCGNYNDDKSAICGYLFCNQRLNPPTEQDRKISKIKKIIDIIKTLEIPLAFGEWVLIGYLLKLNGWNTKTWGWQWDTFGLCFFIFFPLITIVIIGMIHDKYQTMQEKNPQRKEISD
jgi:hypothetical protein